MGWVWIFSGTAQFQKKFHTNPSEIPRGRGVLKVKILVKQSMKLNWNFQGGGGGGAGGQIQKKPSIGWSMDIFWNCTMIEQEILE